MNKEFFNAFYNRLREEKIDEEFIQSISKLIENDEFSYKKLNELIDGEFDE